jgi:hypothetical protein
VLEAHVLVAHVHVVDALLVTADVAAHAAGDRLLHDRLGGREALLEIERVALGDEAGEVRAVERLALGDLPRLELIEALARHALRGRHQDVVERDPHRAGGGIPARLAHAARGALALAVGVLLVDVVVLAARAGVARGGVGVVGPVRHVHAVHAVVPRAPHQVAGREPA